MEYRTNTNILKSSAFTTGEKQTDFILTSTIPIAQPILCPTNRLRINRTDLVNYIMLGLKEHLHTINTASSGDDSLEDTKLRHAIGLFSALVCP